MRTAATTLIGICLAAATLCPADSAVAETPEKDGSFDGQVLIGYRSVSNTGSDNKYREDINLDDGPVLFNFDTRVVPDGNLRSFADEIYVQMENLGSQPYEVIRFGARKSKRFDFRFDRPGVGSRVNPETGREMDDIAPYFHEIDWLSDADRENIFSENAKKVFKLEV